MDDIFLWALIFFTTFLAVYVLFYKKNAKGKGKQIPGPPLIEGLKTFVKGVVNTNLHLLLPKWTNKYGDIFQINLLVKKFVVFNNVDVFKRLVKDEDFRDFTNDRPPNFYAKYVNGGDKEIGFTNFGPILQFRRKTFRNTLKLFGEGRDHFEDLMVKSLTDLAQEWKKTETIKLSTGIRKYFLSLIGFLITGENIDVGLLQAFGDNADNILSFPTETALHTFPFLRFIPGLRYKRIFDGVQSARKSLHDSFFFKMKETFVPNIKRGMIDELISLLQKKDNEFVIDDETIKAMIDDVFLGAHLAISTTLSCLFVFLIKHQEIQDRIYEEIKDVIGDSTPSLKHKQSMPYTEASIMETLRLVSITPLLSSHYTKEDIVFDGYFIPKSTILILNFWYTNHQEDFWKDPWTFRPDRFLDSNGQLLGPDHPNRQRLIPFGSGRRICPGETFSKYRMFLFMTFVLQQFQFMADEKEPLPSLDPSDWNGKAMLEPRPYSCKIKIRHK